MRISKHQARMFLALAMSMVLAGCGVGDASRGPTGIDMRIYRQPTALATPLALDHVAEGFETSCGLTATGEGWCWGANDHGQLGAGTTLTCSGGNTACSWRPVQVAAPMLFKELSPAQVHSCGLDLAGQAWCWGMGLGGQLGDGLSTDSTTPVAVAGGHHFVHIDAGRESLLSCALDDAGIAWCWGPAGAGTLGNGTTDAAAVPTQVLGSQPFVSIGTGGEHACALDASGQAWCWGHNHYGSLGLGVPGAALVPKPVVGALVFKSLAVGGEFTCGLTTAGAAYCWGFALSLGDGSGQHHDTPQPVSGGHAFASLTAGYQHACGLTADGSVWCWGPSALLGDGSGQETLVPMAVAGGNRFRVVQAGGVATCAISLAGKSMCWGSNALGAVGQSDVDP